MWVVNPVYSEANKLSPVWNQFILTQLCLSTEYKTREGLRMLCAYQVTVVFPPNGRQGARTVACLNILAAFIPFGLLPNGEQHGYCFLTFSTSPFQEVAYHAFLPESVSIMSLIDIRSLSSICHCLWGYTKHISALSHFFWFVHNLLCLLPLTHGKWVGSRASGNRGLLYWCNRCSPAGCRWHRHIFCKVAGITGDSGNQSCYMFYSHCQFLAVLCVESILPLVIEHKSGSNTAWSMF